MTLNNIIGDLFSTEYDVIAHQVNCTGTMGSGVAKQVRERYPEAYKVYHQQCVGDYNAIFMDSALLGMTTVVKCSEKYIANMFAQYTYRGYDSSKSGFHKTNKWLGSEDFRPRYVTTRSTESRYTNYEAFYSCLVELKSEMGRLNLTSVAFPYNIGCDRGGANWNIILTMITEVFKDTNYIIGIYKLN